MIFEHAVFFSFLTFNCSSNVVVFHINVVSLICTNFTTNFHDFRDFAASSYINSFNDSGLDSDNDGKYDAIKLRTGVQAFADSEYTLTIALYDLFDELIEIKNETKQFN